MGALRQGGTAPRQQPATLLLAAALLALPSCGGEESGDTGSSTPDCPPPELELPDGSCIRPGVPPDGCGQGFEHDGEYGCEPILPAEDCPPGLMAVPGDTACRPVMPCAEGKWGDIPAEATTQYVDGSYAGGSSTGSMQQPRTTIQDAVDAAQPGAIIAIAAGSYHEDVVIKGKAVRLWGVCPEKVEVSGTGGENGAVVIRTHAGGTEVRGIGVSGPADGLLLSGSQGISVDRVWVHDTASRGVDIERTLGPTSATLTDSLLEDSHDFGLFVLGSQVSVQACAIRRTAPRQPGQPLGRGIHVQGCRALDGCDPFFPATATITDSLVENSHEVGMFFGGSEGTVQGSVVRRTAPSQSDLTLGVGIGAQACTAEQGCALAEPSAITITATLVEDSHMMGVFVLGSDATVQRSVIRRTSVQASDLRFGRGIEIEACTPDSQCDPTIAAVATISNSLVVDSTEMGTMVFASEAVVEDSVIRRTTPRSTDDKAGTSLQAQGCRAAEGCDALVPAEATVTGSLLEDSYDIGLTVLTSHATVTNSIIRRTLPRAANGWFGDGLTVLAEGGPAEATITGTLIDDSARAVLSNFGGHVAIGASRLRCGSFAMEGEEYNGQPFSFDDLGDVLCGCPEADAPCVAVSAGLPPPEPVESLP